MGQIIKGYGCSIVSGIIFGTMPTAIKFSYANGFNSLSLIFFRNLLIVPVLLVSLKIGKENISISPKSSLNKVFFLAMMYYCAMPLLLFSSYHYIPVGTASILYFVYPAMTILGASMLFKQKVHLGQWLCVVLCTLGMLLFLAPSEQLNLFGCLLALVAGACTALFMLFAEYFGLNSMSRTKLTMYYSLFSIPVILAVCLITDSFVVPRSSSAWVVWLPLDVVGSAVGAVLFQKGILWIGSQRASILSTIDPITSVVLGIIIFQEKITVRAMIGVVCVLAASVGIALIDFRSKRHLTK